MLNGLYVITAEIAAKKRSHIDVCRGVLTGKGRIIQYREKNKTWEEKVKEALAVKELCLQYNAVFFVNDYLDLALEVDADGLHLGQDDALFEKARKKLPSKLIGLSVGNIDEAVESEERGADYISAGPIFKTTSKDDAGKPIGLSKLKEIKEAVNIPVVAIGGINKENAASVINAGADALAVISAVSSADDMIKATKELISNISRRGVARR